MMVSQIEIGPDKFKELESNILTQVMEMSKSMIASFEFKLIYGTQVTKDQNIKTLKALEDIRSKNWDKNVTPEEAYQRYLNLY